MTSVLAQLLGGSLAGIVFGKIVHTSDMGLFWNAVSGTLGGILGGQLIGLLLGKTEIAAGIDVAGVIGPFMDGAVTGGIIQIVAGSILRRLLDSSISKRHRSYF